MSTARRIKVDFTLKNEEKTSNDKTILNFQNKNETPLESKSRIELKLKHENNLKYQKKKFKCEHYFNVKNHIELFETGKYFVNKFDKGSNFFAFYPTKTSESFDSIALGLSSFFNYHKNLKVSLFVDEFEFSYLSKHIKKTYEVVELMGEDVEVEFINYDGIEIFEFSKLKNILLSVGADKFQDVVNQFKSRNEVTFFQFPDLSNVEKNKEFYIPWFSCLDSLSFIVEKRKTKIKDIEKTLKYAKSYDLKIDGTIFYQASKNV